GQNVPHAAVRPRQDRHARALGKARELSEIDGSEIVCVGSRDAETGELATRESLAKRAPKDEGMEDFVYRHDDHRRAARRSASNEGAVSGSIAPSASKTGSS